MMICLQSYEKKRIFASNMTKNVIGFDAKRIVRNGTGLGSYGRTFVNDLAQRQDIELRLYAPDKGRDELRSQIIDALTSASVIPMEDTCAVPGGV